MKRQWVYCAALQPESFVLLFAKGAGGTSWSVRDYSKPHTVRLRYCNEVPLSLEQVLSGSLHVQPAPVIPTSDLSRWHTETLRLNARYAIAGINQLVSAERKPSGASPVMPAIAQPFPLYEEHLLLRLPKAAKTHDMHRIRSSAISEDWVTWNIFSLAQAYSAQTWWTSLVTLAKEDNPLMRLPSDWAASPAVQLWKGVSAPECYQQHRQAQVAADRNVLNRGVSQRIFEGESEIDITIRNASMLIFIEAKLTADISLKTTHDPSRNQIVRNIDCLLELCEGRYEPCFWMLVRDLHPNAAHTQLMRTYREQPRVLQEALPYRDPQQVARVAERLSTVRWSDFLSRLNPPPQEDAVGWRVWQELTLRLGSSRG